MENKKKQPAYKTGEGVSSGRFFWFRLAAPGNRAVPATSISQYTHHLNVTGYVPTALLSATHKKREKKPNGNVASQRWNGPIRGTIHACVKLFIRYNVAIQVPVERNFAGTAAAAAAAAYVAFPRLERSDTPERSCHGQCPYR